MDGKLFEQKFCVWYKKLFQRKLLLLISQIWFLHIVIDFELKFK